MRLHEQEAGAEEEEDPCAAAARLKERADHIEDEQQDESGDGEVSARDGVAEVVDVGPVVCGGRGRRGGMEFEYGRMRGEEGRLRGQGSALPERGRVGFDEDGSVEQVSGDGHVIGNGAVREDAVKHGVEALSHPSPRRADLELEDEDAAGSEQALGLAEGLLGVDVVIDADVAVAGELGVGVEQAEEDDVVLLGAAAHVVAGVVVDEADPG